MIAIGCDHGGYELKQEVLKHLEERGIEYKDYGCYSPESVDYSDIAKVVCDAVVAGEAERAFLICGTGIGMSMAANKHPGIRAAACENTFSARMTRMHNDANVLCMGERVIGYGLACDMADLFVDTPFEGGRHQPRVDDLNRLDEAKKN